MAAPNRTRVINLTREIFAVEQQLEPLKKKLAGLNAELDALLAHTQRSGISSGPSEAPATGEQLVTGNNMMDRIFTIMSGRSGDWSPEQIKEALGEETPQTTISSALARLSERGRIQKLGRGKYAALPSAAVGGDKP